LDDTRQRDLWYKDVVIYEVHVKAFFDGSGDGRGDFRGLMQKLDYIQDLGVTAIWLLPFYPSPLRDDGYDIADYRGIHPDYGTLRDFKTFVREAHRRGLRVITELVVNHTSDQHPWFQAARRARRGSARRDWYVWSDRADKYGEARIIFTDTERSNWTWDDEAGAYYWHRFFSHQPDLNFDNPQVVRALTKLMRYWFDLGVDGLRLDAVPYLCEQEGTNCENLPATHAIIKQWRAMLEADYPDRMLLAEANQWPEDVRAYFGDSDECHMAFHFPVMPRIFMALRREDREPIVEIISRTPEIPADCQWALFLRNHDELTLEMVTDEERDYMYGEYAKDSRMRVNVGIRRRLAPLLDNGRRRIELLNSLLLSFPGTPVIYYGDELGMGDNVFLGDRDGVRTPMQWSADRNAGFSSADTARLYLPVIMDPVYGYEAVNVEAQQRSPSSLLQFMQRLIALRRQHKAFGRGTLTFLHVDNRRILAYLRRYRGETILCVANLSRYAQPAQLDLSEFNGWTPLEMYGHTEFPPVGELPYFLTLGPHSFYWFRLEPQAEPMRLGAAPAGGEEDIPAFPFDAESEEMFGQTYRYTLGNDIIARFLGRQRWFQSKTREIASVEIRDRTKLGAGFHLVIVRVSYTDGEAETYALPLKVSFGRPAARVREETPESVLALLRSQRGDGVLYDALADRPACATLFATMMDARSYRSAEGGAVRGFASLPGRQTSWTSVDVGNMRRLSAEQSNTSVILDDTFILKLFRRLEDGPNPDLEITRYLTERTSFRNFATLKGGLEYTAPRAATATLAMVQRFVRDAEDGWRYMRKLLVRSIDGGADPAGVPVARGASDAKVARDESEQAARLLGRRTAECHVALASGGRDPAFTPVPMNGDFLQSLADHFSSRARGALELLNAWAKQLSEPAGDLAGRVLSLGTALIQRFESLPLLDTRAARIRCHGDYHLGQVLRAGDDFLLIDFEGEPLRTFQERRIKTSPLRDVAGMLRSFAYAARSVLLEPAASTDPERERRAGDWEALVTRAFRDAYLETARGAVFLPEDPREVDTLLRAFVLEKTFYELTYELNHRPEWVAIPLHGIVSLAEAQDGGGGGNGHGAAES